MLEDGQGEKMPALEGVVPERTEGWLSSLVRGLHGRQLLANQLLSALNTLAILLLHHLEELEQIVITGLLGILDIGLVARGALHRVV
jgi:hypothetical protein